MWECHMPTEADSHSKNIIVKSLCHMDANSGLNRDITLEVLPEFLKEHDVAWRLSSISLFGTCDKLKRGEKITLSILPFSIFLLLP